MTTDPIDLEALRGHTEGPWEVVAHGIWDYSVCVNGGEVCRITNKGRLFNRPEGGSEGRSANKLRADASLMAAAPNLRDECERLRAELTTRRARDAEMEAAVDSLKRIQRRADRQAADESSSQSAMWRAISGDAVSALAALAPFTGAKT